MQSSNLCYPALNSFPNIRFMPKYNIFKYKNKVIVIVIATVKGLMAYKVLFRGQQWC